MERDKEKDSVVLELFFEGLKLPSNPLKINEYSTIKDLSKFIDSHIDIVKANNGNRTFLPYLNRLQELKQFLKASQN